MRYRKILLLTLVLFIGAFFAFIGCGGGGGDGDSLSTSIPGAQDTVTQLIKADSGGTVELENGISLYIPPYALNEDTDVSLSTVDISIFDGDAQVQGGVDDLHIIGAVFEPDGTILNIPAVVSFPLPSSWTNEESLEWYVAKGNDPLDALPTGEDVIVSGTPGAYIAQVKLSHFSSGLVSYNCHSGTFRNVVANFLKRGCTEQQIVDIVKSKFGLEITPTDAKHMSVAHIQAFLDTFFDNLTPYDADEPVTSKTIAELKEYIKKGRQVVIAFNTSEIWPDRNQGGNKFYPSFAHTANLEIDENGIVQMRSTVEYQPNETTTKRFGCLLTSVNMGSSLYYTYPLDKINEFRTKQNGEAFKEYVLKNFPNTMNEEDFIISKGKYQSVNIYIEKSESFQNPCSTKTNKSFMTGSISIPGYYSSSFTAETLNAYIPEEGAWPYIYGASSNGDELHCSIDNLLEAPLPPQNAAGHADLMFITPQISDDYGPVEFKAESGTIELAYFGASIGDRIKGTMKANIIGMKTICADALCSDYNLEKITGTMTVSFDVILGKSP